MERVEVLLDVPAVDGDPVVGEREEAAVAAGAANRCLAEVADAVAVVVWLRTTVGVLEPIDVLGNERTGVEAAGDAVAVDVVRATVAVFEAVVVFRERRALIARLIAQSVSVHIRIAGIAEAVADKPFHP